MEAAPESQLEPQNIFEVFPRSLGLLGLVPSWILFYFYFLAPWEAAQRHASIVAYSLTALGVTSGVFLVSIILAIGGIRGARLLGEMAPAKFGWKQVVMAFAWMTLTFALYTLLQNHLRQFGYPG